MENQIVVFKDGALELDVKITPEQDTVWLTQAQMVELFNSTKQNISLHINNIFKEKELTKDSTVKEYLTVQTEGRRQVSRPVNYYNLDVIISVGYRVKSQRGGCAQSDSGVFQGAAVVAITLLVAESDPKEKDVMIQIIMNFLNWEAGPC